MANCDVFISYRRASGRDIARSLQLALTARGANCFFDLHDVRKGKFNEKIYSAIDGAKYFVLLLTKGALDRCAEEDDWVRLEIEHALKKGIPIIPVVPSGHPKLFSRHQLPTSIAEISKIQISDLTLEGNFEYDVEHLLEERLEKVQKRISERDVQDREGAFLSAAQRYKSNDGKIDDVERAQLDKLADELSIGDIRRVALIEQVEAQYEMEKRAAAVSTFLSAARRHKKDDGIIDDEERADLDRLAERLCLDKVKCEELLQRVETEYEELLKDSSALPCAKSAIGKEITFNPSKGVFEPSKGSAAVVVQDEPEAARHTKISDVLAARFDSLPKDAKLFVSDIPVKKRATAWRTMSVRESEDSIRLLVDDTLFGSAAEGLAVTGEAVYFKNLMEHPVRVRLDKVDEVSLVKGNTISIGGYRCDCHLLDDSTKRALCKALSGLGAELAQRGVVFGDDTSAADAVLGCFAELKNNSDVYLGDSIPDSKRQKAHRSLGVKEPVSDICVLADATVFGSAEDGLVVTPNAVYFKNSFESPNRISLDEIRRVEVLKKDLAINGMRFSSIGSELGKAAPLLAKGIRALAKKHRKCLCAVNAS